MGEREKGADWFLLEVIAMTVPAVRSSRLPDQWEPWREFENLYTQLGRWMDSVAGRGADGVRSWSPLADVTETDDAYLVEVDPPGVKRDDITVDLVGAELMISGELKEKERRGLFRSRTRRTGEFSYRVPLPQGVNADRIDASLDEGVLTVRLPKSERARRRPIAVNGEH